MPKNKAKSSKSKEKVKEEKQVIEELVEVKEEEKSECDVKVIDNRIVTITLDSYEDIRSVFPTADIQTKCKYQEKILGESSPIPVTDDPNLPINESFTFKVNVGSRKELDNLISTPATLIVSQNSSSCDPNLLDQLRKFEDLKVVNSTRSFDSIVSLYEAVTGDTVDQGVVDSAMKKSKSVASKIDRKKPDKKIKEKSSTKLSKGSKPSKLSLRNKKSKEETAPSIPNLLLPVLYGKCMIDFLPLFYGKTSYTETLVINPVEVHTDERMGSYKMRPKLTVTVSIDKAICLEDPIILNVTVESIYNIPSIMGPNMDYKICAMLPIENSPQEPVLFTNGTITKKPQEDLMKCWPSTKKGVGECEPTKYKIGECNIKNTTEITDVESNIKEKAARIQFNILKRNLMLREGMQAFCHQVQTYRNILFEINMTAKDKRVSVKPQDNISTEDPSTTNMKQSKDNKSKASDNVYRKKSQICLHLMAIMDVASLLYPGVSKVRVACPVGTFSQDKAARETGIIDSFFLLKAIIKGDGSLELDRKDSKVENKKFEQMKKRDKSGRSSKSSKMDFRKKISEHNIGDFKHCLPPKPSSPIEPDPSIPLYNEHGQQTFIIIEIELSRPISAKRDVEDLNFELQELLQEKTQNLSKIVLTHQFTKDYYREVLNQIAKDIYDKYKYFMSAKEMNSAVAGKDFIKHLESIGAYQTYLTSIKGAISLLTATKFRIEETDMKNSKFYQNFISNVYVYLVSEMNDTLNRLICSGLEPAVPPKHKPCDTLLFYAREAAALGKKELADRYLLERICYDDETGNPDTWFDYAIFNLEIDEAGRAYECVLQALAKKPTHRYSLLLLGVLLANKGQKNEAETCFLNLLVYEPRWVEGWVTLYLFYDKIDKPEGQDMAMDMVKKYLDDERVTSDYLTELEDLVWTSKYLPKTMFFRTAVLLLKMRLYEWVENALVFEFQQHFGYVQYLLSAICLYKGFYDAALDHIEQTKVYLACDYTVFSLSGHCLYALKKHQEAKIDYCHAVESVDRPDDLHLVYINCAQILEDNGDHQEARKFILLACKYSPTHYTWFKAGQLYLKENDLLSAEECFSEANMIDNRCPECWAYLTLVNIQLNRNNEVELCYSQALKHNLDEALHEKVKEELKKFNSTEI